MRKCRVKRIFAIAIQRLGNDAHDGEENTNEAVLEDTNPNDLRMSAMCLHRNSGLCSMIKTYIEPRQAAPWYAQDALVFSTRAFL